MNSRREGHERTETPTEILQKRLAKGEITLEQYREMKTVIEEELKNQQDQEYRY